CPFLRQTQSHGAPTRQCKPRSTTERRAAIRHARAIIGERQRLRGTNGRRVFVPKLPFFVAVTMSFIAAGLGATAGHAADYRPDAGDQVRLKVLDWRSTMGDVHEWTG